MWSVPHFCGELLPLTQCFVEVLSRYDSITISLEGAGRCLYLSTRKRARTHPGFLEMSPGNGLGAGLELHDTPLRRAAQTSCDGGMLVLPYTPSKHVDSRLLVHLVLLLFCQLILFL